MTRRGALALFWLPLAAYRPRTAEAKPLRIVCLDDGLAETLLMLGVTPVAVADREVWEKWVVEPPLPPEVADIGTILEPNLEFLQQLRPDIILSIPYLDGIKPLLERVAPVTAIGIYTPDGQPYQRAIEATRQLAALVGRESACAVRAGPRGRLAGALHDLRQRRHRHGGRCHARAGLLSLGTNVGWGVIVAIGYPAEGAYDPLRRSWDLGPPPGKTYPPFHEGAPQVRTGGAGQFLAFIEDERKPWVTSRTRIDQRR